MMRTIIPVISALVVLMAGIASAEQPARMTISNVGDVACKAEIKLFCESNTGSELDLVQCTQQNGALYHGLGQQCPIQGGASVLGNINVGPTSVARSGSAPAASRGNTGVQFASAETFNTSRPERVLRGDGSSRYHASAATAEGARNGAANSGYIAQTDINFATAARAQANEKLAPQYARADLTEREIYACQQADRGRRGGTDNLKCAFDKAIGEGVRSIGTAAGDIISGVGEGGRTGTRATFAEFFDWTN